MNLRSEFRKEPIGTGSLIVTLVLGGWTYYASYLKGPDISLHFGSEVLFVGHNRIGIPCVFTNRGAKPGVIAGLEATTSRHKLLADRLSVGVDTFAMIGGTLSEETHSTFEYFRPIIVPPHGDTTSVVWFVGDSELATRDAIGEIALDVTAYFEPDRMAATRSLRFPLTVDLLACIARSESDWRKASLTEKEFYRECPSRTAGWGPARSSGSKTIPNSSQASEPAG